MAQAALEAMGGAELSRGETIARVQINGFSSFRLPELLIAKRHPDMEFILQCNTLDAIDHATTWRSVYPNVSALWDQSGGNGVALEHWPLPNGKLTIGYAGGLNEHNIVEYLAKLTANREPDEFWVDLETGARTDDKFDIAKVRRILELAKPFVSAAP